MNIYEKLNKVRLELFNKKIKKSGKNKFAGFDYFQLEDIIPHLLELEKDNKLFSKFDLDESKATLTIVNVEDPNELLVFTSPVDVLTLKGTNAIQNIGGTHTYLRRYLYLNAYNIVEPDLFDATSGKETKKKETYKEVSKEELEEAKDNGFVETISSDEWNNIINKISKINDLDKKNKLMSWTCNKYGISSLAMLPKSKLQEANDLIDTLVAKALNDE